MAGRPKRRRTALAAGTVAPVGDIDTSRIPLYEPDPRWHDARKQAFIAYRDMPLPRSFANVPGYHVSELTQWSKQDDWPRRIQEWDHHVDTVRRQAFMRETGKASERMARNAMQLQEALIAPAVALTARLEQAHRTGIDPFTQEAVNLRELIQMTVQAARAFPGIAALERLSRGMATSHVDTHHEGSVELHAAREEVRKWTPQETRKFLTGVDDDDVIEADPS